MGFHKIDPERWEFANDDFVKDQKHLLKNIHRRKPIHSHSQPQGSTVDPERAAFEEEIDRLSRDKTALEASILKFKQQHSAATPQLEDLTRRVGSMEQRQMRLLTTLEKAMQNQDFIEHLAQKLESMDFLAYNKKRRLPQVDHSQPVQENSFVDNHSSSRSEFGNVFHQDFSSKLRLELSPAVSDINLVSHSTQSSNEDGGSPNRRISEGCPKDGHLRTGGLLFAPEALELSDTGASFSLKMDSSLSRKAEVCETPGLHSLQRSLTSHEEGDGPLSCHLNLTLASSSLQVNTSQYSTMPQLPQEIGKSTGSRFIITNNEADHRISPKDGTYCDGDGTLSSSQEALINNQRPATSQARVNDVFWEQFLTERPGSSDTEEACSNYRANPYDEREDRRSGHGMSRTAKNVEQLTL
ncbi:unnamed protein product [Ilex paraguariensis]|uniref:Heat stress transcription factor A-5 n=1 Tax=Ilex paraguariensis TaxID=185542 RepID=A0ABC8RVV3_9AQUA